MVLLNGGELFELRNKTTGLLLSMLLATLLHVALAFFLIWFGTDIHQQSLAGKQPAVMSVMLLAAGSAAMPQAKNLPEPEPQVVSEADIPDLALAEQGEFMQHTQQVRHEQKPETKPETKPEPKSQPKKKVKREVIRQQVKTAPPEQTPVSTAPVGELSSTTGQGGQDNISMHDGGQPGVSSHTGSGQSEDYIGKLRAEIERHKFYPRHAKRLNQEGAVTLEFTLAADGSVSQVTVLKSSGSRWLDEAALQAVNSARSVGPSPQGLSGRYSTVLIFDLRDGW